MSAPGPVEEIHSGPGRASAALPMHERRALVRALAALPGGMWVTCAGDSMAPTVCRGERVRVCAPAAVRPGDVVLLEAGDHYVLHRVLELVPGTRWLLHMGDAGSGDGPGLAPRHRVVGRAEVPWRPVSLAERWACAARVARAAGRLAWARAHRRPERPGAARSGQERPGAMR